jgi:hypothetical protein
MTADIISALVPFGVAGLAIVAVVTMVMGPRGTAKWLVALGMLVVAGIFGFERWSKDQWQASPPVIPASTSDVYWADTSAKADWGGRDLAYTAGLLPKYRSAGGKELCNQNSVGNVVTCWDNRPGGQAPNVDSNVAPNEKHWCAYKDSSIRISMRPDGYAPAGQVYVCARNVPR